MQNWAKSEAKLLMTYAREVANRLMLTQTELSEMIRVVEVRSHATGAIWLEIQDAHGNVLLDLYVVKDRTDSFIYKKGRDQIDCGLDDYAICTSHKGEDGQITEYTLKELDVE
jgi:hypothetical protein